MDRIGLLIGIAAGGYYIYTEIQKQQAEAEETEEANGGQTDITGEGVDAFKKID